MAERTLFYWSNMYNGQIKSGDTYDKARAAYESREAELHDQNTRLKSARREEKKKMLETFYYLD